ncbi:MAG TPA: hypothetical protein VHU18_12625 [Rhizomicrobium sp.]|jgi:hypothetical protein|nr:hypothetical protein [Rhizomicrobium sp.]
MAHVTTPGFWTAYNKLPKVVRERADRNYQLLQNDPSHRALKFKRVGEYWSVRAGAGYRALGIDSSEGVAWFWIGTHDEYERLIRS